MDCQKVRFQHVRAFLFLSLLSVGICSLCVCSIAFIPPALKSEKIQWLKTVNLKCNNHSKLDLLIYSGGKKNKLHPENVLPDTW